MAEGSQEGYKGDEAQEKYVENVGDWYSNMQNWGPEEPMEKPEEPEGGLGGNENEPVTEGPTEEELKERQERREKERRKSLYKKLGALALTLIVGVGVWAGSKFLKQGDGKQFDTPAEGTSESSTSEGEASEPIYELPGEESSEEPGEEDLGDQEGEIVERPPSSEQLNEWYEEFKETGKDPSESAAREVNSFTKLMMHPDLTVEDYNKLVNGGNESMTKQNAEYRQVLNIPENAKITDLENLGKFDEWLKGLEAEAGGKVDVFNTFINKSGDIIQQSGVKPNKDGTWPDIFKVTHVWVDANGDVKSEEQFVLGRCNNTISMVQIFSEGEPEVPEVPEIPEVPEVPEEPLTGKDETLTNEDVKENNKPLEQEKPVTEQKPVEEYKPPVVSGNEVKPSEDENKGPGLAVDPETETAYEEGDEVETPELGEQEEKPIFSEETNENAEGTKVSEGDGLEAPPEELPPSEGDERETDMGGATDEDLANRFGDRF